MSKKKSIEDKVKSLEEREQKIKLQLDSDSDEIKQKVARVGKIALVAGVVSILGYWIFNVIFNDEEEEKKPKKKKKSKEENSSITSRIAPFVMPYINNFLDGVLIEDDSTKEETNIESED